MIHDGKIEHFAYSARDASFRCSARNAVIGDCHTPALQAKPMGANSSPAIRFRYRAGDKNVHDPLFRRAFVDERNGPGIIDSG
jgi:hypothetical protein